MDWRTVFLVLAAGTIAVALLIFAIVPERRGDAPVPTLGRQIRELGRIYGDLGFWRCAPLTITGMAANISIQGLWAGPWLTDVAGLGRDGVADTLLVLALALAGGSVVMGVLASWLERFGISLLMFFGFCAVIFMGFQAAIVFELVPTALWPWVGFGLFANIAMITFAHITRLSPRSWPDAR
jgi:predicted MFS family arabinose efflux permease